MTAWWTRTTSVRKVRVRSSAKLRTFIFEAVPTSADATVLEMDVTPVPTFRSSYTISAITFYELRKAMGTSEFMILVPLFDLKSLGSFRRLRCRDFKSAALISAGACSVQVLGNLFLCRPSKQHLRGAGTSIRRP